MPAPAFVPDASIIRDVSESRPGLAVVQVVDAETSGGVRAELRRCDVPASTPSTMTSDSGFAVLQSDRFETRTLCISARGYVPRQEVVFLDSASATRRVRLVPLEAEITVPAAGATVARNGRVLAFGPGSLGSDTKVELAHIPLDLVDAMPAPHFFETHDGGLYRTTGVWVVNIDGSYDGGATLTIPFSRDGGETRLAFASDDGTWGEELGAGQRSDAGLTFTIPHFSNVAELEPAYGKYVGADAEGTDRCAVFLVLEVEGVATYRVPTAQPGLFIDEELSRGDLLPFDQNVHLSPGGRLRLAHPAGQVLFNEESDGADISWRYVTAQPPRPVACELRIAADIYRVYYFSRAAKFLNPLGTSSVWSSVKLLFNFGFVNTDPDGTAYSVNVRDCESGRRLAEVQVSSGEVMLQSSHSTRRLRTSEAARVCDGCAADEEATCNRCRVTPQECVIGTAHPAVSGPAVPPAPCGALVARDGAANLYCGGPEEDSKAIARLALTECAARIGCRPHPHAYSVGAVATSGDSPNFGTWCCP